MGESLPLELLPASLRDMAQHCGPALALKVAEHYGGCHLSIPQDADNAPALVAVLGETMAVTLCAVYGGEILTIPRAINARRHVRNQVIQAGRRAGATLRELARRFDLTERQVSNIVRDI